MDGQCARLLVVTSLLLIGLDIISRLAAQASNACVRLRLRLRMAALNQPQGQIICLSNDLVDIVSSLCNSRAAATSAPPSQAAVLPGADSSCCWAQLLYPRLLEYKVPSLSPYFSCLFRAAVSWSGGVMRQWETSPPFLRQLSTQILVPDSGA